MTCRLLLTPQGSQKCTKGSILKALTDMPGRKAGHLEVCHYSFAADHTGKALDARLQPQYLTVLAPADNAAVGDIVKPRSVDKYYQIQYIEKVKSFLTLPSQQREDRIIPYRAPGLDELILNVTARVSRDRAELVIASNDPVVLELDTTGRISFPKQVLHDCVALMNRGVWTVDAQFLRTRTILNTDSFNVLSDLLKSCEKR